MATVKERSTEQPARPTSRRVTNWFGLVAAIVAVDLGTKWLATVVASDGDWGLVAPRVNPDFALGALSTDAHPVVLSLLVGAVALLVTHVVRLTARQVLPGWVSALLVAGIGANLVDRLATGAVHDWLHLGFVIANVADFALVIGGVAYVRSAWKEAEAAPSNAVGHS